MIQERSPFTATVTQSGSRWIGLALLGLLGLAYSAGCGNLPIQGDALNERLLVPSKCTLMGEKTANSACVATREALIGAVLTSGDKKALSCFDFLHAGKLNEAKTVFNKALAKSATNPHVISCGQAIRQYEGK